MNWTIDDLKNYTRRRLKDAESERRKMQHENQNMPELPTAVTQSDHGRALDSPVPGEATCNTGVARRFRITLVVRALRPRDWDNNCVKFLQDSLIHAGILPSDDWKTLEGQVISLKADRKEDEETTVIIETL